MSNSHIEIALELHISGMHKSYHYVYGKNPETKPDEISESLREIDLNLSHSSLCEQDPEV